MATKTRSVIDKNEKDHMEIAVDRKATAYLKGIVATRFWLLGL